MQNFSLQETSTSGSHRLHAIMERLGSAVRRVPLSRWQALILLLIVLWLAYSLAQLFWVLMPEPEVRAAEASAGLVSVGTSEQAPRAVDIDALRALSVFGAASSDSRDIEEPVSQPLAPQIEDQAVDTKLSLVLQGVINSSDSESARAIIADARSQQIYGPGDDIENMRGVKVAKVLDLRVILDNKGQYESLWLYKEGEAYRPSSRRNSAPVATASRSWEGDDDGNLSEGSDAEPMESGPIEQDSPGGKASDEGVSAEQIGQKLSDVVAFNIHRENGQIKGYKVRPGRNPAAFEAVGLESGDIVTAVNGTALDNPGRIMEIYRNLGQATSASLEIERNGDLVTIDVELQ